MKAMDEESYRHELRNHFMGQMKNSKLQGSHYYKDQIMRSQQDKGMRKFHEFDIYTSQLRSKSGNRCTSGGDADRALYQAPAPIKESCPRCNNDHGCSYRHQPNPKTSKQQSIMLPNSGGAQKFRHEPSNYDIYESDSNMGDVGPGSSESVKSQKSSKTVVSRKSSRELRKMLKSQCKLHEVIDETLKKMCSSEIEPTSEEMVPSKETPPLQTMSGRSYRGGSDHLQFNSQRDVMTEIAKGDFLECRPDEALTISVDDVVNSKVINPMIRKLQRMYLNNLKEEMSLMEDLEKLPHKVNEVYKATIFKQKE